MAVSACWADGEVVALHVSAAAPDLAVSSDDEDDEEDEEEDEEYYESDEDFEIPLPINPQKATPPGSPTARER